MTDYTEYTRTANTAVTEGLNQAKDISLATIGVFQSLASVLVPLSVSMLPGSEKLVPAIDTVVDQTFSTVAKVVEAQYKFGADALDQLVSTASSV
jgi:hypothetical protein